MESRIGKLKCISGPMMSGKSTELLRTVNRAVLARRNVLVAKPSLDNRYSRDEIVTHDGNSIPAVVVKTANDLLLYVSKQVVIGHKFDLVAIDEVQFFENHSLDDSSLSITEVIQRFRAIGIDVAVAGLPMDFKNVPFMSMAVLLAEADEIVHLTGICVICGSEEGTCTQRIVDGRPASAKDPVFVVGGSDLYECRCRNCHALS